MAMTNLYEIEWSNQAIHNFEEIVGYLSNSWNEKVVKDFVRSVDRAVTHITMFPYAFPATSYKQGVRRYVLSDINTIYYVVKKDIINIVAIGDNRRDPVRSKEML